MPEGLEGRVVLRRVQGRRAGGGDVGGGKLIASVKDVDGNLVGLVQAP
nr:hypothetical protein [Streptomyces scabichelini]